MPSRSSEHYWCDYCWSKFEILQYYFPIYKNIDMKLSFGLLCLALLFFLTLAQPNYQERVIYYGESDNVCRFGESTDSINLIVKIDDSPAIKRKLKGETYCITWSTSNARSIKPSNFSTYLDQQMLFHFSQTATYKYALGELVQLVQKVTFINPAEIYDKPYSCTILGDGTRQHFGTEFTTSHPAEIFLRCLADGEKQKQGNLIQEK